MLSELTKALGALTSKIGSAANAGQVGPGGMGPQLPEAEMLKRKKTYQNVMAEVGGGVGDIGAATGTGLGDDLSKHGASIGRAIAGDPTALIMETISNFSEKMGAAKQHLGAAFSSQTASGAAGNVFRSGQDSFESMGLFAKYMPPAKMMGWAAALSESVDKLRSWNSSLHDANMRFA